MSSPQKGTVFNAFPPFSPGLGSVQLTSLTTKAVVKHVGFYWEKGLLTTQVFEQNAESCPFFDASPGSKCATRIRWIPKSVCDLCGDHLDASLGASQGFGNIREKEVWVLESLLSTDQLDFC